MPSWIHEIRRAARVHWTHRAVSLVAFLTLALAIGANSTIFSVINGLLLQPLPFPGQDRIVTVSRGYPNGVAPMVSVPKFMYWKEHGGKIFERVAAFDSLGSGFNMVSSGPPDRVVGARVSRDFCQTMGVAPMLGRDFTADEDLPGGPHTILLSDALWRRRFGGRPDVVGTSVVLNSVPYTVVGVMPAGFAFPDKAELWTPFQFAPADASIANFFEVVARIRPDTSLEQARAGMNVLTAQFRRANPKQLSDQETATVRPLRERLYGDIRPALLVLLAAVGVVLLIALVNVLNLQLAQVASRQTEIALRTTLGASPWVICRQLLTESLLLSIVSGIAGVLVAYWTLPLLLALSPTDVPGIDRIHVDATVLLFAFGTSVGAGVLFGLLPAWQVVRTNLEEVLREGGHRTAGGRTTARLRRVLVTAEVALALMLTISAALLVKSLAGLRATNPGFTVEHVTTMKLSLPEARYGTGAGLARLQEDVEQRLAAIPGVRSAAMALSLPLELGPDLPFTIEGQYVAGTMRGVGEAQYRAVGAAFFDALSIPVRQGRRFDARDRRGGVPVVMINETAARRWWSGKNPIGQHIHIGQPVVPDLADPNPREIVGVVADVREQGLGQEAPPIVYVPLGQQNDALTALAARLIPMNIVIRSHPHGDDVVGPAERAVWAVDPEQPITDVRTMEQIVSRSLGSERLNSLLLGALAGLALLLAAVGLYGVLAHLVNQQTREIGVRMALGATGANVLGMLFRQSFLLVGVGVLLGLAGAAGLTRFLASLLEGTSATDPWAFTLSPILLLAVALLAVLRPALRAVRIEPVKALRE